MSMNLLDAIAHEEGYYDGPTTRPFRNNNPGDLEYHDWQKAFGATPESTAHGPGRFARFPTAERGFAALRHLLGFPVYRTKTVEGALNVFAPPVENKTSRYVEFVCSRVGCTPDTPIVELLGA